MRVINVAAAQLGPIQKAESREAVVKRMIALMDEAKAKGAGLIVYPRARADHVLPALVHGGSGRGRYLVRARDAEPRDAAAVRTAAQHKIAMYFGYAELTPDGHHFNTCDPGRRVGEDRRQVPQGASARPFRVRHRARVPASGEALLRAGRSRLPGLARAGRHLRHGGLQRPALAGDVSRDGPAGRRDGAARLQHAVGESQKSEEGPEKRLFHHNLSVQAGAYQNSTWVVAVAKAGVEDGHPLIGGSLHRQSGRRDRRRGADRGGRAIWSMPAISTRPSSARRRSSTSPATAGSSITAASPARPASCCRRRS